VSRPRIDSGWLAALHAGANRPPRRRRVPLWAGPARIGSVEPDFFQAAALRPALVTQTARGGETGWQINGDDLTASLHELAAALRAAGLAHVWRNEQLAVTDEQGRCVATVERAVVRPLGITTFAVHLVGMSPDGRHWVQQRSMTKANDPGLWDTLMGGMIPATDSVAQALERETWEEAGLRLDQLADLRRCGRISISRPSSERGAGYVIEHIDWYRCIVPPGIVPVNQDGEVAQFVLMDGYEVAARLRRDEFTIEAALILVEAGL
jgi:8-oxo-dGTP pyrophosphatase MutT (NUDIX family)